MSGMSGAEDAIIGIFFAFVVIVIELALEPFLELQLSQVPSPFETMVLLIRGIEVFAVILAFLSPQMDN